MKMYFEALFKIYDDVAVWLWYTYFQCLLQYTPIFQMSQVKNGV